MSSFEYSDPIIYNMRTIYIPFTDEPYTVVNGVVLLKELPVRFNKVQVKDKSVTPNISYFEITRGIPKSLEYIVDYTTGIIKFSPDAEGKTLVFSGYYRGVAYVPISRIWTKELDGNVTETLDEVINNIKTDIDRSKQSSYARSFLLMGG